jgi:hypothetical protein
MKNDALMLMEKSGWSETRNINTKIYEVALKNDGYKINKLALGFLKEYGGLEVVIPAFRRPDAIDKIYINPIKAINVVYRGTVIEYEKRVGETMTVIGLTQNEQLVLMISESGMIYAAIDSYLTLLGSDIFEAIENMSESKETPEI